MITQYVTLLGGAREKVDIRQYFRSEEVRKYTRSHPQAVFTTSKPLKYIGIEREGARFPLEQTMKLLKNPRSKGGATKGLRLSNHRRAFMKMFPNIDHMMSNVLATPETAAYWQQLKPALAALNKATGIPVNVSKKVVEKGLAAYKRGHRPGMSAHGWARARLTSFVMKGCAYYNPDHKLVAQAVANGAYIWKTRITKCLCAKGCARGRNTPANAAYTRVKKERLK